MTVSKDRIVSRFFRVPQPSPALRSRFSLQRFSLQNRQKCQLCPMICSAGDDRQKFESITLIQFPSVVP